MNILASSCEASVEKEILVACLTTHRLLVCAKPGQGQLFQEEKFMPSTTNEIINRPQLLASTEEEAMALVNRWLHHEVGLALNVESATFNADTFCWHLPIHLAYGATGSLGIVGDIYLHAATGSFIGAPSVAQLRHRADALAAAHGITE